MIKVQSSVDRLSDIWLKRGKTSVCRLRKMTTEIGTEKLSDNPCVLERGID